MSTVADDYLFDWDDEIQEDSSFRVLEPGDYPFKVLSVEKGRHIQKDGGTAPTCNKAIVTFEVGNPGKTIQRSENFLMYGKMEWKLSEIHAAVGLKGKDEKVKMRWAEMPGKTGMCHVVQVPGEGKNKDKKYNNIDKFYPAWENVKPSAKKEESKEDLDW